MEGMQQTDVETGPFGLTKSQALLWAGQQMSPFAPLYNMAFAYRFSGNLEVDLFQSAFQLLIQHSDAMRSRFVENDGRPEQFFRQKLTFPLPFLDFSKQENSPSSLDQWLTKKTQQPFEISKLLFNSALIKLGDQDFVWYLNQHHLITDGWSKTIQYERMMRFYQDLLEGQNNTLESPPSFTNYLQFEQQKSQHPAPKIQQYWNDQLATLPELPALYGNRNPMANTLVHRTKVKINKSTADQIRAAMKRPELQTFSPDLSLYLFFLSHLYLTIFKISGQAHLAIGTPVHNRTRPEHKKTVGSFIELFPIGIYISKADTFASLYVKVRDEYYQFMRAAQVSHSSPALNKTFNVLLNYINTSFSDISDLTLNSTWLDSGHADPGHHLKLQIYDFDGQGEITFIFDGNTAILSEEQINTVASNYLGQIQKMIRNPQQSIGLLEEEEMEILQQFSRGNSLDFPSSLTVVDLWNQAVLVNPNQIAIKFKDQKLTYQELDDQANQLAHYLLSLGVSSESLIGLCLERSLEMVISLLGILKAGGAYVPIDPEYPADRIEYILGEIEAKVIISSPKFDTLLYKYKMAATKCHFLHIEDTTQWNQQPANAPKVEIDPSQLMYIIYTSGSTGQPKGVMNQHNGLVNRLLWAQQYFKLKEQQNIILQKTTYCFDVSVWEFFLPLISGGQLVIAQPDGQKDNQYLQQIIKEEKITMLHFVPPMLEVFLLDLENNNDLPIKQVICSGEALKPHQVDLFQQKLPEATLYNLYGPTEAAIDVTAFKIPQNNEHLTTIPIGSPVANTQLYILNELGLPCAVGVPGELFIGGIQVARGYLNQESLTNERFVNLSINRPETQRLYKTGDLTKWLPDGNIDFLGRIDGQVKIRGFRVETGEIEAVMTKFSGVGQAVVVARQDAYQNNYLVGYYTDNQLVDKDELQDYLKNKLPAYMIPSQLILLSSMPITNNGKLDRKALPDPVSWSEQSESLIAPRNEFEEIIQDIWLEVLPINQVGIHDNFLHIGGESLTGIRVISRLRSAFELDLPASLIFSKPTIASLAEHIERTITTLLLEMDQAEFES